jgi:hypothetical protein
MSDIYKQALRQNLRFECKGLRSTEELWLLSLKELDETFQTLNVARKARSEESLLSSKTEETQELDLKIEILRDVVNTLLEEKKDRQEAHAKANQKQKLLDALARKKDAALEELSVEELEQMVKDM